MLSVPGTNLMLCIDSVPHGTPQLSDVKRETIFASQFDRCVEYLAAAAVPETHKRKIADIIYKLSHMYKYSYNSLNRQYILF